MAKLAQWAYAIREFLLKRLLRFLLPEVTEGSEREAKTDAFGGASPDRPAHVLVQDNGAAVTIFSFASTMLLFASQPTFEFRGFFDACGTPCNLVFFRDVHRFSYHLKPDKSRGGLAYYEQEVRHYMASLGGDVHIALGDSSGGSAALYFGSRCGMDKVIALSPAFPLRTWLRPWVILQYLLNVKRMIRDWPVYREMAVVVFSTPLYGIDLLSRVGFSGIWNPMDAFRAANPRPAATIFYGGQSPGDRANALRLADLPNVTLKPLPTARHSLGVYMARRGMLQQALVDEVDQFLRARGSISPQCNPAESPDI